MLTTWLSPTAVNVLVVALLGLSGYLLQQRKTRSDLLATDSTTAEKLFEQVQELRSKLLDAERRARDLTQLNLELTARVARMEAALPALFVSAHLQEMAPDTASVLDECGLLVLVSPEDDGRFRWVSRDFASALQRTREEVFAIGWRGLVHPDDLRNTVSVEGAMWGQPVRVVNRYRQADGHYVRLRWIATRYLHGVSLAHATVIGDGEAS
jgi:PAS domain-containing protein